MKTNPAATPEPGTLNIKIMTAKDEPEEERPIVFFMADGKIIDFGKYQKEKRKIYSLLYKDEIWLSNIDFWYYLPTGDQLKKDISRD